MGIFSGIFKSRDKPTDRTAGSNLTYYPRADDTFRCEFRVSEPKTEAGIRDIPGTCI